MRPPPHNKEREWIYYVDIGQVTKKIVTNIISFFFTRAEKAVEIIVMITNMQENKTYHGIVYDRCMIVK